MQTPSPDQFVYRDIGTYRVERLLGRGRINAVYPSLPCHTKDPVALMTFILPKSFSAGARQRFRDRFQQKATGPSRSNTHISCLFMITASIQDIPTSSLLI